MAANRKGQLRESLIDELLEQVHDEPSARRIRSLELEIANLQREKEHLAHQNHDLQKQVAAAKAAEQQADANAKAAEADAAQAKQEAADAEKEAAQAEKRMAWDREQSIETQRRRAQPIFIPPPGGVLPPPPPAKQYVAKGSVQDDGKPVPGIEVIVYSRINRTKLASGPTDANGEYAIPVGGVQDILVLVPGYGPAREDRAEEIAGAAAARAGA